MNLHRKPYTIDEIKQEIYKDIGAFYPGVTPEYSPYDKLFTEKCLDKKGSAVMSADLNHFLAPK